MIPLQQINLAYIPNKQVFGDQACHWEGAGVSFGPIFPFAERMLAVTCKSSMLEWLVLLQVNEEEQMLYQIQLELLLACVC